MINRIFTIIFEVLFIIFLLAFCFSGETSSSFERLLLCGILLTDCKLDQVLEKLEK